MGSNLVEVTETVIVLVMVLLGSGESLAIKSASMNNQPCTVEPMLIDLNPYEFRYYPFTISLDRFDGSCNTAIILMT